MFIILWTPLGIYRYKIQTLQDTITIALQHICVYDMYRIPFCWLQLIFNLVVERKLWYNHFKFQDEKDLFHVIYIPKNINHFNNSASFNFMAYLISIGKPVFNFHFQAIWIKHLWSFYLISSKIYDHLLDIHNMMNNLP